MQRKSGRHGGGTYAHKDIALELRGDIQALRNGLVEKISDAKTEMFKILMVHTITIIGVMVTLFQFFLGSR